MKTLKMLLMIIDCWLCSSRLLPWQFRLWWGGQWVRMDERHPANRPDRRIAQHMRRLGRDYEYFKDLDCRRQFVRLRAAERHTTIKEAVLLFLGLRRIS